MENMPDMATAEQREELRRLAEAANEKLMKAGASSAEQSFGLGCALVVVPLGIAILILYVAGVLNLIMGIICLVAGILGLIGVVTLISSQARTRGVDNAYQREVGAEITGALEQMGVSIQEFAILAVEVLSSDAPLRAYLTVPQDQNDDVEPLEEP